MINIKELYWLTGLVEGEGCPTVQIYNRKGRAYPVPRLSIWMTDKDIIERAAKLLRCKRVYEKQPKARGSKKQYGAVIQHASAIGWVMTLYSLLGERRKQQIRKVIAAWRGYTPMTKSEAGLIGGVIRAQQKTKQEHLAWGRKWSAAGIKAYRVKHAT